MQVRKLMTENVVTADVGGSLREAARLMVEEGVGSVIVVREGTPTGILTRTDVLRVAAARNRPLGNLAVAQVMNSPVITVAPTATVEDALDLLREYSIKHLPVVEDGILYGIVTSNDIAFHHEDLVEEVRELCESNDADEAAVDVIGEDGTGATHAADEPVANAADAATGIVDEVARETNSSDGSEPP